MNKTEIMDVQDIVEIIKDVQDINEQLQNPIRSEIIKILTKAQQKFLTQSIAYEVTQGSIVSIDSISTNILYNKLPYYKELYLNELQNKCKGEYDKIVKENNLY